MIKEKRPTASEKAAGPARNVAGRILGESGWTAFWPIITTVVVLVILTAAIVWCRANNFAIHWDEADYLNQAGIDLHRLREGKIVTLGGRILIKSLGRPPAYRIMVLPFLGAFGFHILIARLISLTCFLLSCWFVYCATRRVAGGMAASLAVFIFALSPEIVAASIVFGTDPPLYLAISAMLYYTFESWSGPSNTQTWIGLGTAVGLGFLAKTSFIAIGLPLLAFWFVAGHYNWFQIPSLTRQKKAGGLALLIAAPWWLLNIKTSFEYARYARGFVRNSLGSPSPVTFVRWLSTVFAGLFGYGLAVLLVLVVTSFLVRAAAKKINSDRLQMTVISGCICTACPILVAQLSGTNHLLRHISPAMIPIGICVGLLAELAGWADSWVTVIVVCVLVCCQVIMLVGPVVWPNRQVENLTFPNGSLPWRVMVRYDWWDWSMIQNIERDCAIGSPKIAYLGNGRSFDLPQIQYAWTSKELIPPDVTWLWRYENGPLDWGKIIESAEQNDIVITAPNYVGDAEIKEDVDNQYNAEFAKRLSGDVHFREPIQLEMGTLEHVKVLVFLKNTLSCPSR